jgi:hypothetical protein
MFSRRFVPFPSSLPPSRHLYPSLSKGRARADPRTDTQDFNIGLLALCDASLRRRIIQNVTETYITQSLGELTVAVGMDPGDERQVNEVEAEVRGMVRFLLQRLFLSLLLRDSDRRAMKQVDLWRSSARTHPLFCFADCHPPNLRLPLRAHFSHFFPR